MVVIAFALNCNGKGMLKYQISRLIYYSYCQKQNLYKLSFLKSLKLSKHLLSHLINLFLADQVPPNVRKRRKINTPFKH